MHSQHYPVHGAGLGLRKPLMRSFSDHPANAVNFWEVAPENWFGIGGYYGKKFR
ncbi:MAG: DUF692 family protein, partial [Nitrosomonas sp.]|nr:DUF692 family protein [Nitrosomonas sp.]